MPDGWGQAQTSRQASRARERTQTLYVTPWLEECWRRSEAAAGRRADVEELCRIWCLSPEPFYCNFELQRDGTVVGLTTKPEDAIARMRRRLVGGRSAEKLLHERLEKAMQRLEQAVGIGGAMKQAPPEKSSLANWSNWRAKKEREDYIMKERMVRAQFHGILRRAKEFTERVITPTAVDTAELERMFALHDPRTSAPAPPRSKKKIDDLEVAELWKILICGQTRQEYERECWKAYAEHRRKLRESESKEYTLVVGMRPLPSQESRAFRRWPR